MKWQKLGIYLYFRIASQGAEMAPEPLVERYLSTFSENCYRCKSNYDKM